MSSSAAKTAKKSAFSCEPCRKRKVKCDGEKPKCRRCVARQGEFESECVYKLNPTLSYTQRLEERIKELEEQLAVATARPPTSAASSPSVFGSVDSQGKPHTDEHGMTRSFRGLKVDDHGSITYHGATSLFHVPGEQSYASDATSAPDNDIQRRERLVSHALQQRAMEHFTTAPEPFHHLLNVHWCWIQPLFNFVYRPVFTRDMQTMGPYYSLALHNAVLSHSIRWGKNDYSTRRILDESYEGGTVFAKNARTLVFEELANGVCTIPTVQTLLLLSAQECGFGNSTQAWTYSGAAFRLIDHLGICVDGKRFSGSVQLSDEDMEIRQRIFWSCYFWDKMISLYLGRSPCLQETAASPPPIMFDDSAENEIWAPFGTPPHGAPWTYPEAQAHSASCFLRCVDLSRIFNDILIHMYDPLQENTETEVQECLQTQGAALQQWWDQLPSELKLDPYALPAIAPPSHIVTLNALYHTFKILLYRPMLTRWGKTETSDPYPIQVYLFECISSGTAIMAIFDLFCKTFGASYCVLSLSYSVYIAATIFLLQVQASPEDQQAFRRLEFCIKLLHDVKSVNIVIGSALDLLTRELAAMGISVPASQSVQSMPSSSSGLPISDAGFQTIDDSIGAQAQEMASNEAYQPPFIDNFGAHTTLDPNVYAVMSSLEPLSVRVGALHDSNNQAPTG